MDDALILVVSPPVNGDVDSGERTVDVVHGRNPRTALERLDR